MCILKHDTDHAETDKTWDLSNRLDKFSGIIKLLVEILEIC